MPLRTRLLILFIEAKLPDAVQLDRDLMNLAQGWQISVATAREVLQVQYLPTWDAKRWSRVVALQG